MDMEKEFLKGKDLLSFILNNTTDKDDQDGRMFLAIANDHCTRHDILSIEIKERDVKGEKLQVLTFVYNKRDIQESIMDEGVHSPNLSAVLAKLARYSDNFVEIRDNDFTDRRALRRDTTKLQLESNHVDNDITLIISSTKQDTVVNVPPTDPKLHRAFVKDYTKLVTIANFLKFVQYDGSLDDDIDIKIKLDTPPEWFDTIEGFWKDIREEQRLIFEALDSATLRKTDKCIYLEIEFEASDVDDIDDD